MKKSPASRQRRALSDSLCCPIAGLVLTERAERRAGTRELSSLLDLSSERDTRLGSRPPARPPPSAASCVSGYARIRAHAHTRGSLLDLASVRSRSRSPGLRPAYSSARPYDNRAHNHPRKDSRALESSANHRAREARRIFATMLRDDERKRRAATCGLAA